jgi:O-antigen/teichoic acid export membrane protein
MTAAAAGQGRRLAQSTLLTLATGALLLALNLLFVPLMIRAFGTELYGVLTITWMVLAHLGWLDFGLSRATAKYVAQELALGRPEHAARWGRTALLMQVALGILGATLLYALAPLLAEALRVQADRLPLVILTLRLFAFALPLDLACRSLSGVLQAGGRFDLLNALNVTGILGNYAVYALGILRGADFLFIIYGLFLFRFVSLALSYRAAIAVLPELGRLVPSARCPVPGPDRAPGTGHRALLRFGGWVSVAAMIGPMLLYFDQWTISLYLGVAALPFYAVPFSLLTRLSILPTSLTTTLFPAFSALEATTEWEKLEEYFVRSHRYLLIALLPALFVLFVWAPWVLHLWVGAEFAATATLPLRILILGFGVALLAPLSGALLEAVGRPDLLAKLYLIELPLNVLLVLLLTRQFGLAGAAASYTLRALLETLTLWLVLHRALPLSRTWLLQSGLHRLAPVVALLIALAITLMTWPQSIAVSAAVTLLTLAAYGGGIALFLLDRKDRSVLVGLTRRR